MNTLFKYSYIDMNVLDDMKVCGFLINLGSEWKDLEYCILRRNGSVANRVILKMKRGWYKEFEKILENHTDVKQVSSLIYKKCNNTSEHRFEIEMNGWNREFGVYSFGNMRGHLSKSYKSEEEIAVSLFKDIQEFLLKHGYKLECHNITINAGNSGNIGNK